MKVYLPALPPDIPEKTYVNIKRIEYDFDTDEIIITTADNLHEIIDRSSFYRLEVY